MKIDYSISKSAKYVAYVHVPFVHGFRHFALTFSCKIKINLAQRIRHFAMGILKCIFFVGALVTFLDRKINDRIEQKTIHINANTPYARGEQFGQLLRSQTQEIYKTIISLIVKDDKFEAEKKQLMNFIPDSMREEMQGLANGAQVSFEDVIDVHTFLDIKAGEHGCSVLASHQQGEIITRVVASNHFECEEGSIDPTKTRKGYDESFKNVLAEDGHKLKSLYNEHHAKRRLLYDEYCLQDKTLNDDVYIAQREGKTEIQNDLSKQYEIKKEKLKNKKLTMQERDYFDQDIALQDEYDAKHNNCCKEIDDLQEQYKINKENLYKQYEISRENFIKQYKINRKILEEPLELLNDQFRIFESIPRQKKLLASELDSSLRSHAAAIKQTNVIDTIQSIIFDVSKGSLYLSTGWRWAAANTHKKFSFFPPEVNSNQNSNPSIKLVRNLDWPWMILGSETVCVCTNPGEGKPQFVNVTFPGFLGVLSGMNNHRVALACSQTGNHKQEGMPVTLLFRRVLEEATTKDEALKIISESQPASSMNVTIAGVDGLAKVELDPLRQKIGYAHIVEAV